MKSVSILSLLASTNAFEYTTDYGKWLKTEFYFDFYDLRGLSTDS